MGFHFKVRAGLPDQTSAVYGTNHKGGPGDGKVDRVTGRPGDWVIWLKKRISNIEGYIDRFCIFQLETENHRAQSADVNNLCVSAFICVP